MAKKRKPAAAPVQGRRSASERTSGEDILKRYRRTKTLHTAFLVIVFAALFSALWLSNNPESISDPGLMKGAKIITGVVSIAGLLLYYFLWKCPACGKNLGKYRNPPRCPHCKATLR